MSRTGWRVGDVLLMAADHARRELSRRIRDDLTHLGLVSPGPSVRIADGTRASVGDLITCTQNDHAIEVGEPGRTLANSDPLPTKWQRPKWSWPPRCRWLWLLLCKR